MPAPPKLRDLNVGSGVPLLNELIMHDELLLLAQISNINVWNNIFSSVDIERNTVSLPHVKVFLL